MHTHTRARPDVCTYGARVTFGSRQKPTHASHKPINPCPRGAELSVARCAGCVTHVSFASHANFTWLRPPACPALSSPVQPCPALSSPVQSLQLVRWKANKVRQTVHQPHQSANHPFPGDLGDRNGNGSPDPHTPHIVLVRCWYSCCGLLLGAGRGGKPEAPPVRRQSMFSQTTSARAHGARTALPACPHLPARQIRICEHAPRPESGLRVA